MNQFACRKACDKDTPNSMNLDKSLNDEDATVGIDDQEGSEVENLDDFEDDGKGDTHEDVQASSMISGSYLTTCAFIENMENVICGFNSHLFEKEADKLQEKIEIVVIVQKDERYLPVEYVLQYYDDEEVWEIKIPKENFTKPQDEWTYCNDECALDESIPIHDLLVEIDGSEYSENDLSIVITKEHSLYRSL